MRKFLILGIGFLFTSMLSAADLHDSFINPTYSKITVDQWEPLAVLNYSVTAEATQNLAFQSEASVSETIPTFVASVALIDLTLFYRPVLYEDKSCITEKQSIVSVPHQSRAVCLISKMPDPDVVDVLRAKGDMFIHDIYNIPGLWGGPGLHF